MPRDPLLDAYLQDLAAFPLLTKEKEQALARRVRAGDGPARQEMIQCNLRLVVSVARQYDGQGMPLLDLVEEGNIGLMRAVERFDPGMDCRFSTYAVHWIKQAIRRTLLEKVKNIRVPAYMAELVLRWKRFAREHPGVTDPAEVVRALRLPKENVRLIKRVMETSRLNVGNPDLDDAGDLSGFFEDQRPESDPLEQVSGDESVAALQEGIRSLPPREAEVLRYRFGLDDYPVLTLEDIGKVFRLTRERVRQIEARALSRLRESMPQDAST